MKTWVRHSLNVGALTAGALLASSAAAHANPAMISTDNVGLGNGTQLYTPIQAPVNICGNAVAVAGFAAAGCEGGAAASLNPEWGFHHYQQASSQLVSSGNVGIGNGTQLYAPIQAPVNVCGNAVAVAGAAVAGCEGGAKADREPRSPKPRKPKGYGGYEQVAGAGEATSSGTAATSASPATMLTSGNLGVLNGTQAAVPVQIPINLCGNAIAVLGVATAGCEGGASAG